MPFRLKVIPRRMSTFPDSKKLTGKADNEDSHGDQRWVPWLYRKLFDVPWWIVFLSVVAIYVYTSILADPVWSNIFDQLREGIGLSLKVAGLSYLGAIGVGLLLGIIRSSPPKPATGFFGVILSLIKLAVYQVANTYVEVMRGLPMLTTLVIFAFALIPQIKSYMLATYQIEITFRSSSVETAIIVLALAYGAFMSETFRAGIQSIEKGQIEASRALGLTYLKTMRFVVLPQAIRRILPPLGNDFVSMIKDSALVSVLGLRDITQIAKVSSGSSFRYLETYLTAAVLYLTLTIVLSLVVKYIERRMKTVAR